MSFGFSISNEGPALNKNRILTWHDADVQTICCLTHAFSSIIKVWTKRLLIKANLFRHPHREMKVRNMHQGVTGRIVYDEMMEGKNEGGEEQYAEGR